MNVPKHEALSTAAEWLRCYDSEAEEAADILAVADYLEAKATKAREEIEAVDAIVAEAKEQGRPVGRVAARTFYRSHLRSK